MPTRFLKSWIEANYADRVLAVYRTEVPSMKRVTIGVRSTLAREASPARRIGEPPRPSAAAPAAAPLRGAEPKAERRTAGGARRRS